MPVSVLPVRLKVNGVDALVERKLTWKLIVVAMRGPKIASAIIPIRSVTETNQRLSLEVLNVISSLFPWKKWLLLHSLHLLLPSFFLLYPPLSLLFSHTSFPPPDADSPPMFFQQRFSATPSPWTIKQHCSQFCHLGCPSFRRHLSSCPRFKDGFLRCLEDLSGYI